MKNYFLVYLLVGLNYVAAFASTRVAQIGSAAKFDLALADNDYVKNNVIVRLKPEYRALAGVDQIQHTALSEYLAAIGCNEIKKKFPRKGPLAPWTGEGDDKRVDLSLIYELHYTATLPLPKVIAGLMGLNIFEYAEPHYIPKALYVPNDPQADSVSGAQYHLKNIRAYEAWDINRGDTNVVIGITDTGFDFTHEDLVGNVKLNYQDPLDNIDNDNDGYLDNFKGWDMGMMDNNPQFSNASPHGVFVSGCAGATTDNDTGIAGSGFKCKLLPIKISDDNGNLTMAYDGIVYAADHGCQIINCSWGGTDGTQFGQNIVDYATFNTNALVIAAAGNNDAELIFYPASYNNVINVGGSDSLDKKWDNPLVANNGSNYGIYLDVFAPGEELFSTWKNNTYLGTGTSGTSFACPVAAGAAGIIKSYFPHFTAKQVGEQLKVTCDNMDVLPQNAPYVGKLGRGRINMLRAITDSSFSSVEMSSYQIVDNNDDALVIGDTARLTGFFINYLAPASTVNVTLSTTSPFIAILNNSAALGAIGTLATANNSTNPFVFRVLPNAPLNHKVIVKVTINDGFHISNQYVEVIVNVDYINIDINDVASSITSTARIGYSLPNQDQGIGFTYLGSSSQLYESSLMIGNSATKVSDMVRNSGTNFDDDFQAVSLIQRVIPAVTSDFDLMGFFNDDNAGSSKLSVFVRNDTYGWAAAAHRKYIVRKYTIYNNNVIPLNTLYAGIFADWDVQNASFNKADFDSANRMAYTYSTQASPIYCGIKLLSYSGLAVNSIDNVGGGAGGIDISDGFSTAEKYLSLSTNRQQAGNTTGSGNDVVQVLSAGPFLMQPDDSVVVEFAMMAGSSLQDLQISAMMAQQKYDSIYTVGLGEKLLNGQQIRLFPNPSNGLLQVYFDALPNEKVNLKIMTLQGQTVKQFNAAKQLDGDARGYQLQLDNLAEGMYLLSFESQFRQLTQKLLIKK